MSTNNNIDESLECLSVLRTCMYHELNIISKSQAHKSTATAIAIKRMYRSLWKMGDAAQDARAARKNDHKYIHDKVKAAQDKAREKACV